MSGSTAGILVLAALLLPTLGALAGRLMSRFGPRIAIAVTLLSFGGSAGLALLLLISGAEFPTTPGWASLLPRSGPALQTLAFDIARDRAQPAGELAVAAVPPVVPEPGAVAAIVPPTATMQPSPEPTEPLAPTPVPATLTPTPPPPTSAPPAPTVQPEPPSAEVRTYIVKQGDTLRSIAAQFGVTVEALLRFNGLSGAEGDRLTLGQRIYIPATAPRPTVVLQSYTVKQGDTLRSIAAQFGVTVDALLSFNGLSAAEGDRLRPGQKLLIPPR